MPFQLQKISNHGVGVPVVARSALQGMELMQACGIPESTREAVFATLLEFQRKLLRCFEIHATFRNETNAAVHAALQHGIRTQAQGQVVDVPSVLDLDNHVDSFLQSAKLALADAGRVLNPFFGQQFDHRFERIVKWSEKTFPTGHDLVRVARTCEPRVKAIVSMRNAVDHPSGLPGGRLIVQNFEVEFTDGRAVLREPRFGLSGDPLVPIVAEMDRLIEDILSTQESLLCASVLEQRTTPVLIREIPREQRDAVCPRRFYASLVPTDTGA